VKGDNQSIDKDQTAARNFFCTGYIWKNTGFTMANMFSVVPSLTVCLGTENVFQFWFSEEHKEQLPTGYSI
jgi:hypothetical protein